MLRLNLLCKTPASLARSPLQGGRMDVGQGQWGRAGGGKGRECDGDSKQTRQTECLSRLRSSRQEEYTSEDLPAKHISRFVVSLQP